MPYGTLSPEQNQEWEKLHAEITAKNPDMAEDMRHRLVWSIWGKSHTQGKDGKWMAKKAGESQVPHHARLISEGITVTNISEALDGNGAPLTDSKGNPLFKARIQVLDASGISQNTVPSPTGQEVNRLYDLPAKQAIAPQLNGKYFILSSADHADEATFEKKMGEMQNGRVEADGSVAADTILFPDMNWVGERLRISPSCLGSSLEAEFVGDPMMDYRFETVEGVPVAIVNGANFKIKNVRGVDTPAAGGAIVLEARQREKSEEDEMPEEITMESLKDKAPAIHEAFEKKNRELEEAIKGRETAEAQAKKNEELAKQLLGKNLEMSHTVTEARKREFVESLIPHELDDFVRNTLVEGCMKCDSPKTIEAYLNEQKKFISILTGAGSATGMSSLDHNPITEADKAIESEYNNYVNENK